MLHILLMILKIIGIVLLVLLSSLLFFLLCILFVPIRYRINGHKDETDFVGSARISWLFGLVAFVAAYQEKKPNFQLKLFGIKISNFKNKNTDKLEKNEDTKENREIVNGRIGQERALDIQRKNSPKTIYEKIKGFQSKVIERIRKIKLTIESICDKINYWKNFLTDERNQAAILLVKDHLIKIIKHVLPKKLKGNIIYGFDDPCTTGQVLAGVSIIYPAYHKHLSISPDFSGAVFTGNIDLKGRIYIAYLIKSVLLVFFNKNIQYIIHTFRNKEES